MPTSTYTHKILPVPPWEPILSSYLITTIKGQTVDPQIFTIPSYGFPRTSSWNLSQPQRLLSSGASASIFLRQWGKCIYLPPPMGQVHLSSSANGASASIFLRQWDRCIYLPPPMGQVQLSSSANGTGASIFLRQWGRCIYLPPPNNQKQQQKVCCQKHLKSRLPSSTLK